MAVTPLQLLVKMYLGICGYPGITAILSLTWAVACLLAPVFSRIHTHTMHEMISLIKGMLVHLNRHLSLLKFKLACLHILSTLSKVASWSLPSLSFPAIRMSSAVIKTLGIPLKSLCIFLWKMSPPGTTTNGNHMYLYLSNGQENVVKYEESSSDFRL